jgi:tetratricopeptide (TPR) repeat protein
MLAPLTCSTTSVPGNRRLLQLMSVALLLFSAEPAQSADWLKKIFNPKLPAQAAAQASENPASSELNLISERSGFEAIDPANSVKWRRTTPADQTDSGLLDKPETVLRHAGFDFEIQTDGSCLTLIPESTTADRLKVACRLNGLSTTVSIEGQLEPSGLRTPLEAAARQFIEREQQTLTHAWASEIGTCRVGGADAVEFELTGRFRESIAYLRGIVIRADNALYYVAGRGPGNLRSMVHLAVDEHLRRIRFACAPDTAARGLDRGSPPRWGIDAELAGTDWAVSESSVSNALLSATQVAERGESELIAIVPFTLLNRTPNDRALIVSLLQAVGLNFDPDRMPVQQVNAAGVDWLRIDTENRNLSDEIRRHSTLLHQTTEMACLVTASFPAEVPLHEREERIALFLSRLRITPAAPVSVEQLACRQRWRHAQLFNLIGVYHANLDQYDLALDYFRLANQLDPANSTLATNLLETLTHLGRFTEALNLLNNPPSDIAASQHWQLERAGMLSAIGNAAEAVTVFEQNMAAVVQDESVFEAYLVALMKADRLDDAITATEQYLASHDSRHMALVQIRLLLNAERYEEAIRTGQPFLNHLLGDPEVSYLMAEAYRDSGQQEQAHQVISKLLDDGFDDARTWFLKATIEIEEEQYRAARTSLETVLRRQPDHPEVQNTLELVASLMGQSDNTEIRREIEAVPLPEQIRPIATRSAGNRNASAWYGLAAVAHEFKPGQEYRRTSYGVVHLEDAAAVTEFSTLQLSFNPLSERVFVNSVEVFDREGRLLARGDIDDYYVQTDSSQDLASEGRVVNIPVPGLKPGCRLEYVFTSERPGCPDRFPFTQHCFSRSKPVERAVLHIGGDVSQLAVHGGVSPQKSTDGLTWIVDAPPKLTDEPLQVNHQKAYPTVTISGIDGNWQELAARYIERFADRLAIGPDVRELAENIITDAQATTREEKVAAIAAFVQREFVYQGLEFGVRGQIMPPVQQTLQRRYGDCKDHSLLLYQLLRAVDVPASLCLVLSSGPIVSEIPSMEQFDHMIVFVDDGKDGWFLDATSKGYSPVFRVPPSLAKHDALILDGASSRLVRIPDYPSGVSQIFADRLIQLDVSGQALVTEVVQIKGYSAAMYRCLIRGIDLSKRNDFIRDYLTPEKSDTKPLTGSVQNLDDLSEPLILKASYQIKELLHPTYGLLVGRLPQFLESDMVEYEEIEERQTPFRLSYPTDVIARVRLKLPAGYTVDGSPADVSQASAFGGLASRVTITDGQFEILSRLTRRTGEYSAAQWRDYTRFLSLAGETFAPRLLLREAPVQQASRETAPAAAGR